MSVTPLFQVIVCAAILNEHNEVFLARRAPDKKLAGFWEFPGGKLEPEETLEEALNRELFEELNLKVRIRKLLHIRPYTYPHGNVLILFYLCDQPEGELQLNDHDQSVWTGVDDIKRYPLLPANEEALEKLRIETAT